MNLKTESKIAGAFTGWHDSAVFELANGQKWKQARYKYKYRYRYRPRAKLWQDGTKYFLEVEGMDGMVQVIRSA